MSNEVKNEDAVVPSAIPGGENSLKNVDRSIPERKPGEYFPHTEVEPGVFEIGLVLGGTASVGAYTAGVLDFLVEALDEWDKARSDNSLLNVAQHRVRLRVITGTSGGGICALLAARALHFRFPAAAITSNAEQLAANPFYDVWVNKIGISGLLNDSDLRDAKDRTLPIPSILNGNILETIAESALNYPSEAVLASAGIVGIARKYIANPLSLVLTHSNLKGVPYEMRFSGDTGRSEYFTNHSDYVRFYAHYPGEPTAYNFSANADTSAFKGSLPLAPDAEPIWMPKGAHASDAHRTADSWTYLAQYALGTSAFPAGLPARTVRRKATDYQYRYVYDPSNHSYNWLTPDWERLVPAGQPENMYSFTSLDGGCCDNEPIALARQVLEGLTDRKPDTSALTGRAIILVDPLCQAPFVATGSQNLALLSLLGPTLRMLIQANRFATADLAQFLRSDIYDRLLITPKRSSPENPHVLVTGGDALCGEGLSAFLGFLSKDFRHHDFMLGRRNCQAFLKRSFVVGGDNPLFCDQMPTAVEPEPGQLRSSSKFPVIPLYGTAADSQREPEWPTETFEPDKVKSEVTQRAKSMLHSVEHLIGLNEVIGKAASVVVHHLAERAYQAFSQVVRAELVRKHL
ncbi:patatin-like phospholipase family protein [Paraburkholderia sediminicola]|uniref:patatin-like phospholipase family protein n=1 Tax=Paraburkholderia sediminicola TaxID=458836 RepID=UPI0038B9D431